MPLNFIQVQVSETEWVSVRETIADCIKFAVDPVASVGVRIYPHWVYEVNPENMLGRITAAMKVTSGTDLNLVHCWTLGISTARYEKGANGVPDIMGGRNTQWTWILDLDVWGFFTDDGTKESQTKAENEARLVSATIWRNADTILSGIDQISQIRPLEFSNITPSPFSEGDKIIVASGAMQIYVREALAQ